jgi:dipeptidyl aminopeptidase/acylaminoacyl peptidase
MVDALITAEDLYRVVTLSDPRSSPDGGRVAYVRTEMDREHNGYKSAIWLVSIDSGRMRQFTSGEKRDHSPRWSPDGHWLAFVSNRGDEAAKAQIYIMATDGGEAWPVTHMGNGTADPTWSPDGRRLAFTSRLNAQEMAAEQEGGPDRDLDPEEKRRRVEEKKKKEEERTDPRVVDRFPYRAETSYLEGRTSHLYVVDIDGETGQAAASPRRLTQDDRNYTDPRWIPDGDALLAVVTRDPGEDDLFYYADVVRVPLDGGEIEILTSADTADDSPRPSPDGQWIAYHSTPAHEITTANTEIKLMPAGGGEARVLTDQLDANARDLAWMPDSQGLCFLVPRQGHVDLCHVALSGGPASTLLTADWQVLGYDLSPDGRQAALVTSTDRRPWNLHLAELAPATAGPDLRRLVAANEGWLAGVKLGEVEDLWFESGDGTPIQGWIVKPPGLDPQASYPLVLSIHGGPHVMWSRHESTMWHEWQVLAAQGYVVLACNPRGSDGYGYNFRAALRNHWGEADMPDLRAAVEKAVALGFIDPERLVVTGGSYGGFMTAWLIGHSDLFAAAVAQRGVYDLTGFYSTSDIPRLVEWEFDSAPWDDPQHLWRYSPLAYVENIRTPLLLIHAENDFRAPIPTAEGLFVALRRLKRQVQMVRYPRDGHELSRSGEPKHRVDRLQRIIDWFDRFVK